MSTGESDQGERDWSEFLARNGIPPEQGEILRKRFLDALTSICVNEDQFLELLRGFRERSEPN